MSEPTPSDEERAHDSFLRLLAKAEDRIIELEARLAELERESQKWKDREAGMARNHLDELELRTSIELEVESLRTNLAAMTEELAASREREAKVRADAFWKAANWSKDRALHVIGIEAEQAHGAAFIEFESWARAALSPSGTGQAKP